jgi:hypothetical protein
VRSFQWFPRGGILAVFDPDRVSFGPYRAVDATALSDTLMRDSAHACHRRAGRVWYYVRIRRTRRATRTACCCARPCQVEQARYAKALDDLSGAIAQHESVEAYFALAKAYERRTTRPRPPRIIGGRRN